MRRFKSLQQGALIICGTTTGDSDLLRYGILANDRQSQFFISVGVAYTEQAKFLRLTNHGLPIGNSHDERTLQCLP